MNRKLASTLTEDKLQLLLDNEAVFAMIYNDQIRAVRTANGFDKFKRI